jgi:hypothetical protein
MDAFVPDLSRFHNQESVTAPRVELDHVMLDVGHHDPIEQRIESSHVVITQHGVRLYPVSVRYAWPAELDAMAQVADMELEARYADYDRSPFHAGSRRHVSIYRLVDPRD